MHGFVSYRRFGKVRSLRSDRAADKIESKPCRDLERLGNSSRQASLFFSLFLSDASLLAVRLISPCRAAAGGGGGRVVWW
ncbi:hypothetical protein DY000_02060751 [Brassica cretica]|uniref:Uncharacterized protein n=1 Tax=Brassica cretica TaxID=69181 RepID=A0ABQ7AS42_BRACR|nr:hypothetical protein DY000_02060751 [Brassica cretica]